MQFLMIGAADGQILHRGNAVIQRNQMDKINDF